MTIVFGSLAGTFQDFFNGSITAGFSGRVNHLTLYFIYLGIAKFITVNIANVELFYLR